MIALKQNLATKTVNVSIAGRNYSLPNEAFIVDLNDEAFVKSEAKRALDRALKNLLRDGYLLYRIDGEKLHRVDLGDMGPCPANLLLA